MSREQTIGTLRSQQFTKKEMLRLIEENFAESGNGSIAVVTTTNYGVTGEPAIMQTITFCKVLDCDV